MELCCPQLDSLSFWPPNGGKVMRATLSLRRSDDGWVAGDVFQYHNAPVGSDTRRTLFAELFASGPFKPGEFWDANQLALPMDIHIFGLAGNPLGTIR